MDVPSSVQPALTAIVEFLVLIADSALRLAGAAILGAVVGAERESRNKPAGLRTNIMVAMGAAGFVMTASRLLSNSSAADPTRIVTGVATGIGFLGAGSIIRRGSEIEGVTTAAGIWVVGAIGCACGAGEWGIAVPLTVLSLLVLAFLDRLESRLGNNSPDADE